MPIKQTPNKVHKLMSVVTIMVYGCTRLDTVIFGPKL